MKVIDLVKTRLGAERLIYQPKGNSTILELGWDSMPCLLFLNTASKYNMQNLGVGKLTP